MSYFFFLKWYIFLIPSPFTLQCKYFTLETQVVGVFLIFLKYFREREKKRGVRLKKME
jgi:hypothetical protein